jgi:hypothetical protein
VYDDTTRTVTWYVGTVEKSATATNDGHKVVTFAVGLVPSASQLREEPELVTNQVFRGVDSFTKSELEITAEPLNTILTEEGFDERFSPVVE